MKSIPSRQQVARDFALLRKIPFTILIVIVSLIAGVATKALWVAAETSDIQQRFGYGLPALKEGHFLNILTGMLVMPQPWMYLLVVPLLAIGAGFLEYRYGAVRMLIAVFVTHVGAVLLVAGMLELLSGTGLKWVHALSSVYDIGASNSAFGVVGAASAALPVLWRRRIRTGFFVYCLTFVLYSAVIWDFTHFAGLLIGFAIGPWVVGRKYELGIPKFSEQSARSYAALFVAFLIFHEIANYISPGNGGIIGAAVDDQGTGLMVVLGTSLVMAIIAYGLYAGRRVAWKIAIVLTSILFALLLLFVGILIVNHTFYFQVYFEFMLYGSFLFLLVFFRKHFNVRPNKATRRTIYRRLFIIGIVFFFVNAGVIYILRNHFTPVPSFPRAIGESAVRIFDLSDNEIKPTSNVSRIYFDISGVLWFLFFIGSLAALIFTTYRARDDRADFEEYDRLLHEYGSTSIGWMSRWNGMAYWVNPSKTAGFAYRLENNIAIVLSDPVGSPKAIADSVRAFERSCRVNGWHPIFYGVTEKTRKMLSKQGYLAITVGEDTIIPLKDLEFAGKSWQSIRSAMNRAKKDGITMRTIQYNSVSVGMQDQLQTIAAGWANDKSLPEMGFTLGTLNEAKDPEVRMHLAIDSEGTVHGMTSWMPIYKQGKIVGWTIDIMQRRLHAATMPGVIEYLIAESAMDFKQEGFELMSLSAAPLSREGKASGPIEQMLDVVAERMEPYYGFKSLFRFKQKFQPHHEPMYFCYRDGARLPSIAIAIGKAYMPDVSLKDLALSLIK